MTEFASINPATGSIVWKGFAAEQSDIDSAIDAAKEAFPAWSTTPFEGRAACLAAYRDQLLHHEEELLFAIAEESGKPLWECKEELKSTMAKIDISIAAYKERTPTKQAGLHALCHKPHGVIAILGPYNFPLHLPNGHIVPALLAGNTVIFKPSEKAPLTGELMAACWQEAGLPDGAFSCVQGDGRTGQRLAEADGIDGLFFTGSAATGEKLQQLFFGRILALELGGNNPLIAWETTEMDAAVYIILQSAFLSAGQRCTCARRLILPDNAFGDQLLARLIAATKQLRIGSYKTHPEPFMGPVISEAAAKNLKSVEERLTAAGATPLLPMKLLQAGTGFVTPLIIDVTNCRAREDTEFFGPFLQVIRVHTFAEALDEANNTAFGLAAGLIDDSDAHWNLFLSTIRAGIVNRNRQTTGASSAYPFGGIGKSGNYRPGAFYAADYSAYPVASTVAPKPQLPDTMPPGIIL